ncbi:MAG: hypothetical protein PF590_01840 [Candidatus Delongbacteria bacterium]|nr:hypothetical protein [Candidatus Delongbacteria bacterium]
MIFYELIMKNAATIVFICVSMILSAYGQENSRGDDGSYYATSKIAIHPVDNSSKPYYPESDNRIDVKDIDERRVADILKKVEEFRLQLNILYKYADSESVFRNETLPRINNKIKSIAPHCLMDVLNKDVYNVDMVFWINVHPSEYLSVLKYVKKEIEKER